MSAIEAAVLILFPLMMAYSALSDLFTMTISNTISIVLVLAFVAMALVTGMPPATLLVTHLAAGACVLILTFIFFTRGWIGGGDAKLAAATAVWLGWDHLLEYGLQASIMGALLTIGIVYCRRFVLPDALAARDWIVRLHTRENGVPYGIALAIAGLVIYPETALWRTIIG
jgi:prepilin peptidase CpaA